VLAKKHRISKDKEYKKIFRKSKRIETENFSFRIAKRQNHLRKYELNEITNNMKNISSTNYSLPSRFGFVVSNKIDKRATRRNGLKRRLRAVIGDNLENITTGYDVVVLVKKQPKYPYKYEEIKREVIEGLKKAGVISF